MIYATCVPADIRHPTDPSRLNEARELTKALIDTMHAQIRDAFGREPRTHCKQARRQFLAVAKKKRPQINKILTAIRQQLGYLRRNLANINALPACGASLLATGRYAYQRHLVASELVRPQTVLDQSDSRCIHDRIVSLSPAHIRPIVRRKERCNVEFEAKISISVTGEGFMFLERLSFGPYGEGEDLKAQTRAYRRRHGHYPKAIYAD